MLLIYIVNIFNTHIYKQLLTYKYVFFLINSCYSHEQA